ncbi:hypothetical protein [Tsukamurella spumae]|uniref:Uncharacterized protein n=1 Tax=Tsukamurella spumae TaxID=44753 RepID=A0A846X581_9ACTN|nr:hypothetical protein [Tsukamurella spumae]NKY19469.1 hypothetical protein [Tsukamurella spumae]
MTAPHTAVPADRGPVDELELFARCVLPGCQNPVTGQGEPCSSCREAFGELLAHRPGGEPLSAAAQRARDSAARAAYRVSQATAEAPRPRGPAEAERKRNQTCWLCTERRTCTSVAGRWECDTCRAIR